jgi:hypothetical protein
LLDDDRLPAGIYEVRGYAIDTVGNERTVQLDDSEMIQLPVRQASRMSAGKSARTRNRGTTLITAPAVAFGARVPIRGRVTDAFGDGLPYVTVEVSGVSRCRGCLGGR